LPGVQGLAAEDGRLQFVVQGALDPVVKLAAQYPVLSLTSHEPTLEEAFLAYYRPDGVAPAAQVEKEASHVA
jgi:ABC-2 type transport system ATP-binding protein